MTLVSWWRGGRAAALVAATSLCVGAAMASGSSDFGVPDYGSSRGYFDDRGASAYNLGKSIYERKFGCSECPLAGRGLDRVAARNLLDNKLGVYLEAEESQALDTYLVRRFRL